MTGATWALVAAALALVSLASASGAAATFPQSTAVRLALPLSFVATLAAAVAIILN